MLLPNRSHTVLDHNNSTKIEKKLSHIEIVSFFEDRAMEHKIRLCGLKIEKNDLLFTKFGGEVNNVLDFMQTIETHYPLLSFQITIEKDIFRIEARFSIKTFHNGGKINLPKIIIDHQSKIQDTPKIIEKPKMIQKEQALPEPILKKETKTKKKTILGNEEKTSDDLLEDQGSDESNKAIENNVTDEVLDMIEILPRSKTLAIFGEYVLLNNEWLKVGDSYKGYTITNISNESIQFKKKDKEALMEMFDDE